METNQYSWFPENGNCPDLFNSIEEAIAHAQQEYEKFENKEDASKIISIGSVRHFDFRDATESVVDSIEDIMYNVVDDFVFGCDMENECAISEKDKVSFKKEATEALLPIIEKYVFINPQWVCTPTHRYDLSKREFVD